jgi:glutamine---fructose-6-phosphate transaminase (isomerizing)
MSQASDFDAMLSEIREQPEILRRSTTLNQINLEKVCNALLPMISSAAIDNVMIVARGSSDNAATLGKYLIESLVGLPVALAAPSVVNLYEAQLRLKRTLVIGVSQSGRTNEVIDFLSRVGSEAGFTIGITNNADSDLVKMGLDGYLFCHAGTEQAVAATKSFTTTMMAFYLLATMLAQNTARIQALTTVPELVATVFKEEKSIQQIGTWLAAQDECIILARGYNYPVALEIGLKLQEASYIRAKAFSGADFQHGPMAITEQGVPFLIFKGAGSIYEGMSWLEDSVRAKGASVAVVSSFTEEQSTETERLVKVQECPEWLSPFAFTTAGQLLAYYTARARGINPNNPRWLNKVTTTR